MNLNKKIFYHTIKISLNDGTVDPMATSQLVQVVQMDYCYGIVRWGTHLVNSVAVV